VPEDGEVGSPVSLAGATVVPGNATYQTISWVVKTPGAGVIDGSNFIPAETGTVTLTARILSGAAAMQPYTQDFDIVINPAFVPVSAINGLPATRNAVTGELINLNTGISVAPSNATNKTIVWSVKTAGDTGLTSEAVASGSFTPENAGTASLTATILNGEAQGSNFTKETSITIIRPVTGISNIPTNGTKGYEVDLAGAIVAPENATNKTIVWTVSESDAGTTGVSSDDLADGKFTPAAAGTLKLIATILDGTAVGTPFTRNATIAINEPGETTPDVGLGEDTSIVLKDNSGSPLSKDGVNQIVLGDDTYYVTIGSGYTDIVWRINGTAQAGVTASLIYPDTSTAGIITIAAQGRKNGKLESSGTYKFEIVNSN
jgi:hypothetical protein